MTRRSDRPPAVERFVPGQTRTYVLSDSLDLSAVVAYAGASGDMNPIHFDPDRAEQSSGSRRLFAQGMLTMGLATSAVEDFAESMFVAKLGCRFLRPVWLGSSLDCTIAVESVQQEQSRIVVELTMEVRANDEATVLSGYAVLVEVAPQ